MATSIVEGHNTGSESTIAGYFDSGEDAHLAINALLDEGFLPSQIGAAFHTGSGHAGGGTASDEPISGADTTLRGAGTSVTAGNTLGGAESDTTAVQPGYLGGGTGTPFGGAAKPRPITGSELEHTGLPSELEHDLPHDAAGAGTRSATYVAAEPSKPTTATGGSWTSKLKHLFEPKHEGTKTVVEDTRQDFGTGEGQLDLGHRHAYSASSFESSATSAGVPAEQSRHLSQRLSRGGAIVTVSVTGRAPEVERIFERHHGIVRFEGSSFDEPGTLSDDSSVEVFGHLHNHYPTV